jgi:hypothetical protein
MEDQNVENLNVVDIRKLRDLLRDFDSFAAENEVLVHRLGLRNKFVETIGEGLGLILCFEEFGDRVTYEWPGRRGKGYDIALNRSSGKSAKIQIKTNTDRVYTFKLPTVEVDRKVRDELKQGNAESILKLSDAKVDQTNTDFYLLVHKNADVQTCYILDKARMKKAIREDYMTYFNRKDARRQRNLQFGKYHFGVSVKSHAWWPMLNKNTVDSLKDYERDWSPIRKALGL